MTNEFIKEVEFNNSDDFQVGSVLYMGMGLASGHRVCLSVGYKIDYALKKAQQFEAVDKNVRLTHINKVLVGDLEKCTKFNI